MRLLKNIMFFLILSMSWLNAYYASSCDKVEGYMLMDSAKGVELCVDGDDSVQIIDLSKGAKLEFLYEQIGNGNKFKDQKIDVFWNKFSKKSNAFSVVNGTFFYPNNGDYITATDAGLAFPLKKNNTLVTMGYEKEEDNDIRYLGINDNLAILRNDNLVNIGYSNVLGGLSTDTDKHNNIWFIGRNLIGVNQDGTKIYILVSDGMKVSSAKTILIDFGADSSQIMMLDGSGSSQLRSKHYSVLGDDSNEVDSQNYKGRPIPQAIGILAGSSSISRGEALKSILDKFDISSINAGFNSKIFGNDITIPSDVSSSTKNYDYIVTAYNRGITNGNNGKFRPNDSITLAEFLVMIIRTIPIPTDNPNYNYYDYHHDDWYYKYAKTAYNAGLIENRDYSFNGTISSSKANEILSKALTYFKGKNSGISIYAKWSRKYADIDLYLYSKYDGNKDIKVKDRANKDFRITNMQELKTSGGIVYWDKHSSDWGANLDYDSWGGNSQPWAGVGEERVTVDSKMVRRPGTYSIILCYYSGWRNSSKPNSASVEWWGINGGKNINTGGVNFNSTIGVGECNYVGTLNTYDR